MLLKRTRESRNRKTKRTKKSKKSSKRKSRKIEIEEQEIEKETIANLTNKLSIISKEILLPHFLENIKELTKQLINKTKTK